MRRIRNMSALVLGLAAMAMLGGCSGVEIGPFQVEAAIGEGDLPRDLVVLPQKGLATLEREEDLCNLPSEEQIAERFIERANIPLENLIRLSRLELVNTQLTATAGDFSSVSGVAIFFVPAPVDGVPQEEVVLGEAENPEGFGQVVTLVPDETVDFLDLIRANDENDSEICPKLRLEVTFRSVPLQNIHYEVTTTVNAYARVNLKSLIGKLR